MIDVMSIKIIDFIGFEKEEWFDVFDELVEELGYFELFGVQYVVVFIEVGLKLVVIFEFYLEIVVNFFKNELCGFEFWECNGWLYLVIIVYEESWFCCKCIYQYFDWLIDDGFFEDFEQVLFFGSYCGGYVVLVYFVVVFGFCVFVFCFVVI